MTQEIIEMARDSGMELYGLGKDRARFVHHLEAFAKLVAEKALADHAMQEVQRLGQEIEQEPVAHLWECLGRWSAYLVNNGTQAECAPPSWLVDAVKNATTPPQRTWVGLTEQEHTDIAVECGCMSADWVFYGAAVERKVKENNT